MADQDSYVQVATDGSGKKIDNAALTREPVTQGGTGETVYRQRVAIGDDEDPKLQAKLRGEAGERQRPGARIGLAENGGGVVGFDEAACAVTILERCN